MCKDPRVEFRVLTPHLVGIIPKSGMILNDVRKILKEEGLKIASAEDVSLKSVLEFASSCESDFVVETKQGTVVVPTCETEVSQEYGFARIILVGMVIVVVKISQKISPPVDQEGKLLFYLFNFYSVSGAGAWVFSPCRRSCLWNPC